jgi:poly-gamma-glutamate synthesis protein (capsule biosynthesis protein)
MGPTAKLAFLGDVMLGRLMNEAAETGGPRHLWGDTLEVLEKADLRLINLECVISDRGEPWAPEDKVFHFRAFPWAIEALKAAKIDYASLANNHSLDFGREAMLDMLERLDKAGIKHAGAGKDAKNAMEPAIMDAGGLKIGVLSASDNEPGWAAKENAPGINFLPTLVRPEVLGKIGESAKLARKIGADIVVFSDHWGPNMRQRPDPLYVSFAQNVMDMGIDIFHGHSAHIFQGIGLWGRERKPILFDTGDFVDDYAVDPFLRNDQSFIFLVDVDKKTKKPEKIELVPVCISRCQVNLAPDFLAVEICEKMITLCREMGTAAKMERGRLVILL